MEVAVSVLVLAIAIFLVVKGGDIFVSSSSSLAKKMHIPQIVFGATFVSLATTLGELLISIFSSVDGTTDLAVGNAVGSAICNIALICGIGFLFMQSTLNKGGILKYYLLLLVTAFITVVGFFYEIFVWQAIVLIVLTVLFFVFNYVDAKSYYKTSNKEEYDEENHKPLWLLIILFLLGACALGGGAYFLVDKVEFLAKALGVSEQFIGLTVVAIGTSLPELTTMLTSIKKKSPDLAIGNIIGANILNLTLILAVPRLIAFNQGMQISKETAYISLPFCLVLTLILVVPILLKRKTYKWQGIIFLTMYALYVVYLILNAVFKFV